MPGAGVFRAILDSAAGLPDIGRNEKGTVKNEQLFFTVPYEFKINFLCRSLRGHKFRRPLWSVLS